MTGLRPHLTDARPLLEFLGKSLRGCLEIVGSLVERGLCLFALSLQGGVPVGDPYPPYVSLSKDELDALAAVLRTTVLAHRFSATAAA